MSEEQRERARGLLAVIQTEEEGFFYSRLAN
jgi:hypothetical protein